MPTQKIFKQRVRARMTKTGESYTAARRQLLRKAAEPDAPGSKQPADEARVDAAPAAEPESTDLLTSDDAVRRASGKGHAEWFALLDAWGATEHGHTEIARWLSEIHGVRSWWTQSITVAYERSRGLRARHQMADGFSISVTRTVAADAASALAAFTDGALRERWLPGTPMRQRPTRAARSARFDWADPPSRVVVTIVPKGTDKAIVAVGHEQLPDAATADRLKGAWRAWLGELKAILDRG
jgi:uncharacterized protein YndB with AHSA1/START domain